MLYCGEIEGVMNKKKSFWDQVTPITIISLGIMILGVGFTAWGMLSIWSRENYAIADPTDINLGESVIKNVETLNHYVVSRIDKNLYPVYPLEGDYIGTLTIPALNLELPIFQGTGHKELKKGVGHFMQSMLPGEKDNSVLSGHRETVFRKLGDLVIGDLLIVETTAGIFTYEVSGTRIVDKNDRTVIVPTENAVLTLTTCYPFYYIGHAPDRYIVHADLLTNK